MLLRLKGNQDSIKFINDGLDFAMQTKTINYQVIGYLNSSAKKEYEAQRQAILGDDQVDVIVLEGQFSGDCLKDLAGFDHIWLIYDFHHNESWKPMVLPPRGGNRKRGVFATRSPYRPNPIGISCVKLVKIEKNRIYISQHDLLDGTPILDIKPYIKYADSFEVASLGWLDEVEEEYEIVCREELKKKIDWVSLFANIKIFEVIKANLSHDPLCGQKKRVKKIEENLYVLAVQTWRIEFRVENKKIELLKFYSGYSQRELDSDEDPYNDLSVHRQYISKFKAD